MSTLAKIAERMLGEPFVELYFTGVPQPAGSKRAFVIRQPDGRPTGRVVDANPKAAQWKAIAAAQARAQMGGYPVAGPIAVEVEFLIGRPRGHFSAAVGKLDQLVKRAPPYPACRPDTTKLWRALEDALTGILWYDDAQVIQQLVRKVYGNPPGARLRAWRLEP
jgi:Holliday junction resolvase RusA-like endonuclease